MIGWIAVLAVAIAAFGFAALALRLPREGWAVFGAILLFGLSGYAWQGSPTQPSRPKAKVAETPQSGEAMVEARRALFDPVRRKPDYLTLSDGYARRGRFDEAAKALRSGLNTNPAHLEGWLALGMALVGHADGNVTPAASYAYAQARQLNPANPAADYFLGFSYLQTGQIRAAREVWASLLDRSPADAPWRPELEARIARMDEMIANAPMLQ
ncbi:MAG: tetratricopeptide repeat protein [Erythrobacter sp.]|uniref:tetratricopeptide repeat protein n=1 Tax=Erythrobacter sp. TaxID=1042 RepID=UPI00260D4E7A|nr:tetratricopeptide repeat protein [Erythrobacter sp.]MDJ0977218.1 tetratricopeptide repeat protein [Erythrobacter sp.]